MNDAEDPETQSYYGQNFFLKSMPFVGQPTATGEPGAPPIRQVLSFSDDVSLPIPENYNPEFFGKVSRVPHAHDSVQSVLQQADMENRRIAALSSALFSQTRNGEQLAGGAAEQQEQPISNVLGKNETVEDVLVKTSYVWEQRIESAQLFDRMRNIVIGDDGTRLGGTSAVNIELSENYEKLYSAFRVDRLSKCFPDIWSGEHNARLSTVVISAHGWYKKLENPWPLVPTRYSNLTYFGNMMAHVANDFTVIANPGLNFESMMLTRVTCLAAPEFNTGQTLFTLLAGDASVGKSYIMLQNKRMLPPGWVNMISHLSTMALTDDGNDDFGVLMIEETPATMTQETSEKTGHDNGASFLKCLLTNKIAQTRTVSVENGQRKRCVHVTSKMMTGVFATNGRLDLHSPLLKRYLVIKPSYDPLIAEKINKLDDMNVDEEVKNAILRQQVIAYLVQQTQLAIGMGCIKPVNMDAFTLTFAQVVKRMRHYGYPMTEAKSVNHVAGVVRTLVVMRAVCEACLSEKNVHLRVDLETGRPIPFQENYLQHFANIEALLVAQEPEILFGISMCHSIFGDDTQGKLFEAAKNLCGIEVKDGKFVYKQLPSFLPTEAVGEGAERRMQFKRQYVEMNPLQGRGLEQLVTSLCANCIENPSRNNMNVCLKELQSKNLEHKFVDYDQDGETKFGHSFFRDDMPKQVSPIVVKRYMADNFEQTEVGERKSNRSKELSNVRYYILLPALMEFVSQSDAMKQSLLDLQHIGTIEATHIINIPLRAKRTQFDTKETFPFYGIYECLHFKRKEVLLFHHSHNALLPEQFNMLSTASMFDFGNQDLPQRVEARKAFVEATRKRAKSALTPVRAITSAIDYASFMNRQQVCAASYDDVDIYYWPYFVKACLEIRRQMKSVFGPDEPKIYPDSLLKEAQYRNQIVDLQKCSAPIADKLARLARVNDLSGRNVWKKQPPSEYHMHNVAKGENGLESLRLLFSSNCSDVNAAPVLDARSKDLINSSADGIANWSTVCAIFSDYKHAERTSKAFLRYCGLDLQLLPPTVDNPDRKVAVLRNRSEMQPIVPKASLLLVKRTAEVETENNDDSATPQAKKPRAENDDAERNLATKSATTSKPNADAAVDYDALFEQSKKLRFFETGSVEFEEKADIGELIQKYPEVEEPKNAFNPLLLTSSSSRILPQCELSVNPYTGTIIGRRAAV